MRGKIPVDVKVVILSSVAYLKKKKKKRVG